MLDREHEVKKRLNEAFREMRKRGIMAKQDFTCCMTCGNSEIERFIRKKDHGYCFYHAQDKDRMFSKERMFVANELYLCYGGATSRDDPEPVGRQVCEILRSHAFEVEWDGSEETRIRVIL